MLQSAFASFVFSVLFIPSFSLVQRTRLAVHKQSFKNLLRQNGCRMTKVYWWEFALLEF